MWFQTIPDQMFSVSETVVDVWLRRNDCLDINRFHFFFGRFRGFLDTRVNSTRTKDITQHLLISRRVQSVIYKKKSVRLISFLIIRGHESLAFLIKHAFGNNTDLFSVAKAAKESHVLCIPTDICVGFSLGEHVLE